MTNQSEEEQYKITPPETIFREKVQERIDSFVKEIRYSSYSSTASVNRYSIAAMQALENAGYKVQRFRQNPKAPDEVTSMKVELP